MSIEAMKRIKSLLQDGDKIDSHTISAVVAECDAVILTQQPATGEPADVVRDAIAAVREQYRGTDWGKAAECICDAIDAAMLAAKDASAGRPLE